MSRLGLTQAGFAALVLLLAGAPAQAMDIDTGPYFKFFFSPPDPPPPQVVLPAYQARVILRREGARIVGKPRLRGREIIAYGRDASGAERRFTLDAATGEVLSVTLARAAPDRPRPRINAEVPPPPPLGPPVHPAGPLDADRLGVAPPMTPPEQVMPPPPPKAAEAPPPPPPLDEEAVVIDPPPPQRPEARSNADSALSPIKPLRPQPGAPKVDKLPQ
ncbi:hypothetical protein M2322_000227 [Rhodoblastus acidophilus]|uniref:hypothetical protein n=1 Tax=Rhodoblastus acidophilus TaxID=1074 RepID=UPI002224866E|nr:hypothetical protein [Rhodoblastus acidophilus]MCW2314707.1 hypothetical protein [Rhodoblastus acidophilus]